MVGVIPRLKCFEGALAAGSLADSKFLRCFFLNTRRDGALIGEGGLWYRYILEPSSIKQRVMCPALFCWI